jgi:uncharacterized protein
MPDLQPSDTTQVVTPDGIRLATDVYLPDATKTHARFGAVVVRLPYGRRGPVAALPSVAAYVLARGWAFVAQDVRGKFDSSGDRVAFVNEIADSYTTLDWLCKQPWSDQRVIAAGDSYYGYTAWAAVASGHPSVRGVMARVTSPTISTHWMYQQGIFRLGNMAEWAASTWMGNEWDDVELNWKTQPAEQIMSVAFGGRNSQDLNDWATHGIDSDWWRTRNITFEAPHRPIVSVHAGGWWDLLRRGQIHTWRSLRNHNPSSLHLLHMDAVDHVLDPVVAPGTPIVDVMADPALRAQRLPSELQPLLDVIDLVESGGPETGKIRPAAKWNVAFGEWKAAETWPPTTTAVVTFHLGDASQALATPEGGTLSVSAPSTGTVSWTHDPNAPVPTVERDLWRPLMSDADHRSNHERDDVATFSSPPFTESWELSGSVRLRLEAAAESSTAHIMASLCHIWPDGTATEMTEGACLLRSHGTDVELEIDLGELAYRLQPGARLRLAIAASSYPRYVLNSDGEEDPWSTTRRRKVRQSFRTGSTAQLLLTVQR